MLVKPLPDSVHGLNPKQQKATHKLLSKHAIGDDELEVFDKPEEKPKVDAFAFA